MIASMHTKVKIYDSVHGFIRFNDIESQLIDSFPFQRLHYIHQLGISYLVYPGGTHSRFEHSIGVMELAGRIFDWIMSQYSEGEDLEYWKQIVKLAALCHDLGHLPFSHVAERVLLGEGGHERWTLNIIQSHYLKPIWDQLQSSTHHDVVNDLIKISIGEKKLKEMGHTTQFTPWERLLTEIITGDFFGADRIDYLIRDAKCTGVAYGLIDYHQLIEMLRILPWKNKLVLGIEENGIESCEALLLARHFMHRRVYQYATAQAYSFHLKRFMKKFYEGKEIDDLDQYLWMTDNEILSAVSKAAREGDLDANAIYARHQRYKAIEIPEGVDQGALKKIKDELSISDKHIYFEFSKNLPRKVGFSFPILKKNGAIVDGATCSEILIPSGPVGWIFLAPQYELDFRKALSCYNGEHASKT